MNLAIFGSDGVPFDKPPTSVTLLDAGGVPPGDECYCTWMPYQVAQAAKAETVEKMGECCAALKPLNPLIIVRRSKSPPETEEEIQAKVRDWLDGKTPALVLSQDVEVSAIA